MMITKLTESNKELERVRFFLKFSGMNHFPLRNMPKV